MGRTLNYISIALLIITVVLAIIASQGYINKSIVLTSAIISFIVYIVSKTENDSTIYESINNKNKLPFKEFVNEIRKGKINENDNKSKSNRNKSNKSN